MTENERLQKAIEEEKELYEIMKDRYEKLGLESCKDRAEEHELNIKWLEELEEHRAIGTIDEFKALKEKSEPKKPIRSDLCTCPSCGTHNEVIKKRRNTVAFDTVYCWHCGQAIEIKRD